MTRSLRSILLGGLLLLAACGFPQDSRATPIPEVAKGCAYAQNHPVDRADDAWRYDAVNEVWFDDEDALRARIRWMADAVGGGGDDDFMSSSAFLAVREAIVLSDVG